jgi:type IV pilus assembly protein PilP
MTRWYLCLICGVLLFSGLFGCAEEPSTSSQSQHSAAVASPPAKQPATPEVKMNEAPKEAEFVYSSEGRRDPFVPLSKIRRPVTESAEPQTPLQSYDLSQFRLVGVIVGKGASKAMVLAPDGKSYVIAKGVKIGKNNGVVLDINSDAVRVKEKYYDFSGNIIENIQEIAVPKREGV